MVSNTLTSSHSHPHSCTSHSLTPTLLHIPLPHIHTPAHPTPSHPHSCTSHSLTPTLLHSSYTHTTLHFHFFTLNVPSLPPLRSVYSARHVRTVSEHHEDGPLQPNHSESNMSAGILTSVHNSMNEICRRIKSNSPFTLGIRTVPEPF